MGLPDPSVPGMGSRKGGTEFPHNMRAAWAPKLLQGPRGSMLVSQEDGVPWSRVSSRHFHAIMGNASEGPDFVVYPLRLVDR